MDISIIDQVAVQKGQNLKTRLLATLGGVTRAERLGFAGYWISEGHCRPEFSGIPSPLTFLAAISSVTSTIRLGTAAVLAPYYHPFRLFEDAALVDTLSGGRLMLGLGRSPTPLTAALFDVPLEENAIRMDRAIRFLRDAWTEEGVELLWRQLPPQLVRATPRPPTSAKGAPLYVVCNGPESLATAVANDLPILVTALNNKFPEGLKAYLAEYRARCADLGKASIKVHVVFITLPHRSYHSARNLLEPSLGAYFAATSGRVWDYDTVLAHSGIVGTPEHCIARLEEIEEQIGPFDLMCWFNPGGMIPQHEVEDAMAMFADIAGVRSEAAKRSTTGILTTEASSRQEDLR